ncbi:unnamed protein product [Callosobruchus maculatus]|uniref:Ionotropic glutamate receptor C-terminal domain-containing protein n=1 Tax=Callosobruchus maculatus TaxID=64391 RepID=A0A653C1H5_CALMS|nr:unnamed protein product [Callosobruchus maculatus]
MVLIKVYPLQTAEEGTLFKKVGQHMIDHPENVKENDEGVLRAENEKYAFFMESTSIEYAVQRHCSLKQYGGLLDEKGYGIAMRKGNIKDEYAGKVLAAFYGTGAKAYCIDAGDIIEKKAKGVSDAKSFYRKRLSLAILKLQSSGVIDELKRKWWQERRGGGQCEGKTEVDDADPLELVNVQGCFFVTIYGTILAVILVIIEHLLYVVKVAKKNKLPFVKVSKIFIDKGYSKKTIHVNTDSRAALIALASNHYTSKLVWDCHNALKILAKTNKVTLSWVPSHIRVGGNERADSCAKEGTELPLIGPEPACGISYMVRTTVSRWVSNEHQKRWDRVMGNVQSRRMMRDPRVLIP